MLVTDDLLVEQGADEVVADGVLMAAVVKVAEAVMVGHGAGPHVPLGNIELVLGDIVSPADEQMDAVASVGYDVAPCLVLGCR